MPTARTTRCVRLPIGSLVILLALIGWGLQYKTSLYHDFRTSPEPPAKLLSDAERPQTEHGAVAGFKQDTQSRAANPHQLATAVAHREPVCDASSVPVASQIPVSSQYRAWARFFVRPPPLS